MTHPTLTPKDQAICDNAIAYIHEHRSEITNKIAGDNKYKNTPALTLFMAGSPGAGKTETSKLLLSAFDESSLQSDIIRLDPDELRSLLPEYKGHNSHIFQQPIAIATNHIYNYAIKKSKNILVDGTFSSYEYAYQNVSKAIKKKRSVIIYYLYVDPILAWKFTQAREVKEGRKITKQVFIDALFSSNDNVNKIKREFKEKVAVYVFVRDYIKNKHKVFSDVDNIDKHVQIPYSKQELEKIL